MQALGYRAWYVGTLTAYDANTHKLHSITIEWDDGDANWVVDLMACRKCKEWRFIQDGEDKDVFLEEEGRSD